MSAWIVDREHIRALVDAADHYRMTEGNRAPHALREQVAAIQAELLAAGRESESGDVHSIIGRILWAENVKSIQARYPDTRGGKYAMPGSPYMPAYRHSPRRFHLLPGAVSKAVACYEYQSCEHDEWDASPVREFCRALLRAALDTCPGNDGCPWGIESDAAESKDGIYASPMDRFAPV